VSVLARNIRRVPAIELEENPVLIIDADAPEAGQSFALLKLVSWTLQIAKTDCRVKHV
jgi:hypothetical protein